MNYFFEPNSELETSIDDFFRNLSEINIVKYGGTLSLMLLGSLSRGEGSWGMRNGKVILFSDIEFFTITPSGFNRHNEFSEDIINCSEKCFEKYKSELFHVDNTFLNIAAIPNMERKILTYDAKNMGKIMFGNDCISIMPTITIDNINQEDIWDVLLHRMFYVSYYGMNYKLNGDNDGYRYTIAKNSLDLMTVILANNKLLVSGYNNKLYLLRQLGTDCELCDYFSYCLCIKLRKATDVEYSIAEMENHFLYLVETLNNSFNISIHNRLANFKVIIKRRLGIIKRMIRVGTFTLGRSNFLNKLVYKYKKNEPLNISDLKISFILNGYPNINELN